MNDRIFLKSEKGYFGEGKFKFGGCFIPEILYPALNDLQRAYKQIFQSKGFQKELKRLLKTFVGRPTPLIYAKNASMLLGNEIYLKFEGLANTGAHKINNALAQVLLAKRMKKTHIIAETGAGQHGVAVASVCAFLKMPCTIFMGATDMQRQRPNVFIMEQFGAEVVAVDSGTKTLKDAVNEALRQWSKMPDTYFYVLGSALGPYPYPDIVRDSQAIIGKEMKKQVRKALDKYLNTFLPDYVVACVGGGSNAMGTFSAFLEDTEVRLVGIEAGGDDFKPGKHAMRLAEGSGANIGIAHGYLSYFLQDKHGQISNTHSISAGLDYAGVGPQLAHLKHIGRVEFMAASDDSALEALQFFARHEGILPALESSHALAGALEIARREKHKIIVVNVSGRGDKDIFITAKALCTEAWRDFLESELKSVEKLLKRKNKPKPEHIKEEQDEEVAKQRTEELKLALQDISHEDMCVFDSCGNEVSLERLDVKKAEILNDTPSRQTQDSFQTEYSGLSLLDLESMKSSLSMESSDGWAMSAHTIAEESMNSEKVLQEKECIGDGLEAHQHIQSIDEVANSSKDHIENVQKKSLLLTPTITHTESDSESALNADTKTQVQALHFLQDDVVLESQCEVQNSARDSDDIALESLLNIDDGRQISLKYDETLSSNTVLHETLHNDGYDLSNFTFTTDYSLELTTEMDSNQNVDKASYVETETSNKDEVAQVLPNSDYLDFSMQVGSSLDESNRANSIVDVSLEAISASENIELESILHIDTTSLQGKDDEMFMQEVAILAHDIDKLQTQGLSDKILRNDLDSAINEMLVDSSLGNHAQINTDSNIEDIGIETNELTSIFGALTTEHSGDVNDTTDSSAHEQNNTMQNAEAATSTQTVAAKELKQPLSSMNMDTTKRSVFKTDPKLSKICGKSLNS